MDDAMKPSADGPEKTLRWSPIKIKTSDCILWALSRVTDVEYAMIATWFSIEKLEPNYHANIVAVLAKRGFEFIETTLEDKGKRRFVEAKFDDGSNEGHAWYIDEDERVWGLGPDRSVSCDCVQAEKLRVKMNLRIERVFLIPKTS